MKNLEDTNRDDRATVTFFNDKETISVNGYIDKERTTVNMLCLRQGNDGLCITLASIITIRFKEFYLPE